MSPPTGVRPTIRQLEYLVALDTHEHIGKAAEACFVSQPTISTQVREMEKHLGVVVVERVGRGVAMTAAGRELAERARAILRDTDELVESGHRSATALTGPLRLAAIPTAAPYLLPRVLPAIRGRHPEAEMHLSEIRTAELTAALAAAEIDLGIIALPVDDARIACAKILDDYFLLAIAVSHPLALQSQVPIGSLEDETVLLLEEGHCLRDHVRDICDRAGARGDGDIQGTSLATVCQMVAAGMGVTLMPASARAVEARDGAGLVVRPFSDADPCRQLALIWRRNAPAAALYRELSEIMATELASGFPVAPLVARPATVPEVLRT